MGSQWQVRSTRRESWGKRWKMYIDVHCLYDFGAGFSVRTSMFRHQLWSTFIKCPIPVLNSPAHNQPPTALPKSCCHCCSDRRWSLNLVLGMPQRFQWNVQNLGPWWCLMMPDGYDWLWLVMIGYVCDCPPLKPLVLLLSFLKLFRGWNTALITKLNTRCTNWWKMDGMLNRLNESLVQKSWQIYIIFDKQIMVLTIFSPIFGANLVKLAPKIPMFAQITQWVLLQSSEIPIFHCFNMFQHVSTPPILR